SARKPPIELAPPTSTANSVRRTATLGEAPSDASGSFDAADAVTSGAGGSSAFAATGFSGSSSLGAPGSGDAMMDLAAISGVAGVGGRSAAAPEAAGRAAGDGDAAVARWSFAAASARGLSGLGMESVFASTVAAAGATLVVAGATFVVAGATFVVAGATVVVTGATVVVTGATIGAVA